MLQLLLGLALCFKHRIVRATEPDVCAELDSPFSL